MSGRLTEDDALALLLATNALVTPRSARKFDSAPIEKNLAERIPRRRRRFLLRLSPRPWRTSAKSLPGRGRAT